MGSNIKFHCVYVQVNDRKTVASKVDIFRRSGKALKAVIIVVVWLVVAKGEIHIVIEIQF